MSAQFLVDSSNFYLDLKHLYAITTVKAINVIYLGQREIDNINRMITISGSLTHINYLISSQFDHINQMITLSVITLSGFHYNYQFICDQQTLSFEFGNEFALTLDEVPQLGLHEPVGLDLRNGRTVVGQQQLKRNKIK
jgi:hypothetical protein